MKKYITKSIVIKKKQLIDLLKQKYILPNKINIEYDIDSDGSYDQGTYTEWVKSITISWNETLI